MDKEGNSTDSFATDPIEVDRIAREAWKPIYAGNVANFGDFRDHFLKKYKDFLFRAETVVVQDLDPEQLFQAFVHSKHNSGGLDGWTLLQT